MAFIAVAIGAGSVIGAGASIYGASMQSNAAQNAAQLQADAANNASNLQYTEFQQQQGNLAPYLAAGQSALFGSGGLFVPVPGSNPAPVSAPQTESQNDWVTNRANQLRQSAIDAYNSNPQKDMLKFAGYDPTKIDFTSKAQNDWKSFGQQQVQQSAAQAQQQANLSNVGKYELNPALFSSPGQNFTSEDLLKNMDPAYQFDLQQGQQALERSAAAKGQLMSGGTLKDLTNYAQGQASNEYQNAYNRYMNNQSQSFNRLASLAGLGQTGTGQVAQAGMNMANNVGNIMTGAANAQGAASIAQGNAWGSTLSSLGNNIGSMPMTYGTLNMMNNMGNYYSKLGSIGSGGGGGLPALPNLDSFQMPTISALAGA